MSGSKRFLPAIALAAIACVILCLRGTVPPELAIKGGGHAEPVTAGLRHDAAGPTDSAPSGSGPSPKPAAVHEIADAAVRVVLSGLRENRPEVVWDALPASYQRDVNDLVHLFANRLHPEAWRWLQQLAAKGGKALRLHAAAVLPEEQKSDRRDDDASHEAKASIRVAALLDKFSQCGSGGLEMLKTADVGAVIRTGDRQLMADLRDIVDEYSEGKLRKLLDVTSKARITIRNVAEETVTVVFGSSATGGAKFEFVRVDGKWVPRQLADHWGPTVAKVRKLLEQVMPSDTARDNFGATFQLLAGIDSMLEKEMAMQKRGGDDSLDAEAENTPSMYQWLILLGYLLGDGVPSDTKTTCEFTKLTKKRLAERGKRVVVISSCGKNFSEEQSLELDVLAVVRRRLKADHVTVVDSHKVATWIDNHGGITESTDLAPIGREFAADYIILFQFSDFGYSEPNSPGMYRGHASVQIVVVEMANDTDAPGGKRAKIILRVPFESKYPANRPVSAEEVGTPELFKPLYLSRLSEDLARKFIDARPEDEREFGDDGDEDTQDARVESTPSIDDLLMSLGYYLGGPPSVDPDFHQKTKQSLVGKDKIVLVYCYAGKELKWDNEALDYDVAKHVAYRLNNNKIKVIDPDLVYDWLEKNTEWTKTAEIGKHFRVDYVVHIDVKDYRLFEPHAAHLYRGRADIIVNVVKMDEDKRDGSVIYTTPIKSFYPTRSPVDANVMSYAEFKKHYLSALSDEIGRLFYAGDAGQDISNKPDAEQSGALTGGLVGALIGNPFGESGEQERKTAGILTPREREARAVTNSDVVNMVSNGISDSIICNVVRVRGGRFDTSPKGIEALKRAKVSDLVIEAMLNAGAEDK